MSATSASTADIPLVQSESFETSPLVEGGGIGGVLIDIRVAAIVAKHARERIVTRMFGLPPSEQSLGDPDPGRRRGDGDRRHAAAAVAPGARRHRDGGAVLNECPNESLAALMIEPGRRIPGAGAIVGLALVTHFARPAVARSAHHAVATLRAARVGVGRLLQP